MTDEDTPDRDTMGAISHANPYTGETLGQVFSRGPIVAADGGHDPSRTAQPSPRTDGRSSTTTDAASTGSRATRTMREVSHTPPHDADGANRVFERGRVPDPEDE